MTGSLPQPPSERPPLDARRINATLPAPWQVTVAAEAESTNTELLAAAAGGAPEGQVLAAEWQRGGRGRLGRSWSSPPGAGLTFSVLVRPTAPPARWGWLPLLTGLAVLDALVECGCPTAVLKWPNDVMLGPAEQKVGGILVQAGGGAAVVGLGLNVSTTRAELPVPTATSLALEGATPDRSELLAAVVRRFGALYREWLAAGGNAVEAGLISRYQAACSTLGRPISLELAEGNRYGTALDVDDEGRLLVQLQGEQQLRVVAAGDITHLRLDTR